MTSTKQAMTLMVGLNQYQGGMCISGSGRRQKRLSGLSYHLWSPPGSALTCGPEICTFHLGFSLGEVKTSGDPAEVLTCLGLGSCVAVCLHDPVAKVAGMAHIVLPDSEGKPDINRGKYADTGVPLLLEMILKRGAIKSRVIVKIAGGAQISKAKGLGDVFQIGERNVRAVQAALDGNLLRIKGSDTGGYHGRTMRFYLDTGQTLVTTAGKEIQEI